MGRILNILFLIVIRPLEILFECIFSFANRHLPNPGITLIFLSLTVSLLCLPLYHRADKIQRGYNDMMKELQPWIDHIKRSFKGDERIMMLQNYYRLKGYSPLMSLRSSVSLLLQIPFFISMYRLISSLTVLKGVSFGPISDLGQPDGMITLGGTAVNVLPILMTIINVVSTMIYGRGKKLKEMWQTYLLAAMFLVLLYRSPSGLVVYWTCNNIFSLLKNAVTEFLPKKAGSEQKVDPLARKKDTVSDRLFIWSALFLSVFLGVYIPATVIGSSPLEFINLTTLASPDKYIFTSLFIAIGFCFFWTGIYYLVLGLRYKKIISGIMVFISLQAAVNWFLFDKGTGTMDSLLKYEEAPVYSLRYKLMNIGAVILCGVITFVVIKFRQKIANYVFLVALAGIIFMGVKGTNAIISDTKEPIEDLRGQRATLSLSTEGQNVMIIMLDRALGPVLPYIMEERPELMQTYDGFTYYPNTLSFGGFTNFATPSLFGGYEYTPDNLNARSDMLLADKQDEALKVLPALFSSNGYDSYFINPTYAGYKWIPDLSIFDDCPDVTVSTTLGQFSLSGDQMARLQDETRNRNFFLFSVSRCSPVFLRYYIYNAGAYNCSTAAGTEEFTIPQVVEPDGLTSTGISDDFDEAYSALSHLSDITQISGSDPGCFVIYTCDSTHEPMLFQLPDYEIRQNVDNREYTYMCSDRELDGRVMHMRNDNQITHYQTNLVSLTKLGEMLDQMRQEGVYDNTRIIIVADHGRATGMFDDLMVGDLDTMRFTPLLMVKDFDSHGFTVDDTFMTNADVPSIAMNGLIDNPVNPFTGNPVTSDPKFSGDLRIIHSGQWDVSVNNGYTFLPGNWYSFTGDDITDENSWVYLGEY